MATMLREYPATEVSLDELITQAAQRITDNYGEEITIDCSSITIIRSSMLDRLIRLHLDAKQCQKCVVLANVNELVFEILTLTRLDRMLKIRRDESHDRVSGHHLEAKLKSAR